MSRFETGIERRKTVEEVVAAYHEALRRIETIHREMEQACESVGFLWPRMMVEWSSSTQYRGGHLQPKSWERGQPFELDIRRRAWMHLIDQTGLRDIMSPERRRDLDKAFDRGEMPPMTTEAVLAFLNGAMADTQHIMRETVLAAAERLRRCTGHKTNGDGWQLGSKAIIEYALSTWRHTPYIQHGHREADLNNIDVAFHLMDGVGVPKYPERLSDRINASEAWHGETTYFRWKGFRNGNLHLTFKRKDLVDRLNLIARRNELRAPAA